MNQKIERVGKHLYKRSYQTTTGQWTTNFYGCFKDWSGKRRTFPLGSDLKTARNELKVYEARNIRREDFDADKAKAKQGITFSEWAGIYFKEKVNSDKGQSGVEREHRSYKKLEPFFGPMLLSEIRKANINEYRQKRLQGYAQRQGDWGQTDKLSHGQPRTGLPTVSFESRGR